MSEERQEELNFADLARKHLSEQAEQSRETEPELEPDAEPGTDDLQQGGEEASESSSPTASEPETSPPAYIVNHLRQKNYQIGDDLQTDADLAPKLEAFFDEHAELQERLAAIEAERAEYEKNLAEAKKAEEDSAWRAPASAEPAAKSEGDAWPKFNPEWESRVTWDDEAERYVPRTKYDSPEVAEEANRWYAHQRQIQRRMVDDPWGVMLEAGGKEYLDSIREDLRKEYQEQVETRVKTLEEQIQQRAAEEKHQNELRSFFQSRKRDFFEVDETGNPKIDSRGNVVLSERGRTYNLAEREAKEVFGLSDPALIHKYALSQAELQHPAKRPESKPEPKGESASKPGKAKAEEKRFLDRVTDIPERDTNRNGASKASDAAGEIDHGLSFRDAVLRDPQNAEILGRNYAGA